MRGAVEAPLPRAWPRCDSPLSAAGERRREGGREGGEGEGAGRERGEGDPGRAGWRARGGSPGAGRQSRSAGREPCLPSPAAMRAEAAARQRASERAGGRTERLERPTLRVPLTPTRGSALPFYPAPSRRPGKPGTEHGAGAGGGTDSLPSPHKGGGERTSRRCCRPSTAFARQPRRRRLRGKPGPELLPLRSLRRLRPCVRILAGPLLAAPRGADSVNFTHGCRIGLSPRPRPPRPRLDLLAAGLVSWLLLSTSTAVFFKTFYKPTQKTQLGGGGAGTPYFLPPFPA